MAHGTFRAGDLTAIIGDNTAHEQHRAGYNGIWSLTHRTEAANLFVPTVAGLNFEHIFDGERFDRDRTNTIFFEPRNARMNYRQISDVSAELHQPPTPTFQLESWTRFTLVAPHYIDMTFRCIATQHLFTNGYIGLFWASYINAPDDKSMYFRGSRLWQQLCTQRHNDESTLMHTDDKLELRFHKDFPPCLFRNNSPMRYEEPFFYGNFRNHMVILMFDRTSGIRFTHSPSGGGSNAQLQTTNPAWDFQFLIPKYEVKREYQFRARLAYRPRCSREDIMQEVGSWRKTLK
jgi:hypothetical protein